MNTLRSQRDVILQAFTSSLDACITTSESGPLGAHHVENFEATLEFGFSGTGDLVRSRTKLDFTEDLSDQLKPVTATN